MRLIKAPPPHDSILLIQTSACRQQAIDNFNMLMQDPRPLEDKREELAKVKSCPDHSPAINTIQQP